MKQSSHAGCCSKDTGSQKCHADERPTGDPHLKLVRKKIYRLLEHVEELHVHLIRVTKSHLTCHDV